MKLAFLDFEFNGISERDLNLVSMSVYYMEVKKGAATNEHTKTFWLYNDNRGQHEARELVRQLMREEYIFVSYVMEAEYRSLLSLFKDEPDFQYRKFNAIDLYLEYRNLLNHHHEYAYGDQLVDGKVIKTTPPPNKWDVLEYDPSDPDYLEQEEKHHDPSYSLAACTFKLLGEKVDTDEKNLVRGIIISGDPNEILKNKERILLYNESDIKYLSRLFFKIRGIFYQELITLSDIHKAALSRGSYAVATAKMLRIGYPINRTKVDLFTRNVSHILGAAISDCLDHSAEVESFRWDKRKGGYVQNQNAIRDWVKAQAKPRWRTTKKGVISLSKDAFKDWYDSESPGFAGAFCRYAKTKQSLNGFVPASSGTKKRFEDFIGSDNRVRPNFGIYSSQSSRSQPGATGYLWLKAKWMQNFLEAPKGYALASADFASQEFLIAAIISQDQEMLNAYASGDPYLAFGKSAKLIPPDGTKKSHAQMREVSKTCVLGMSYLMSKSGLAPRLSAVLGRSVSEDEAQEYIDLFDETYSDYADWRNEIGEQYSDNGRLELSDGWTMWGDNDNFRSAANFPIQGEGAVVMREAVKLLQRNRINVIATVHDSIAIQYKIENTDRVLPALKLCMIAAFDAVMKRHGKTIPIRVDGEAWSQDYEEGEANGFKLTNEFIHEKAKGDYARYKKFFDGSFVAESRCEVTPVTVEKIVEKTDSTKKRLNKKEVSNGSEEDRSSRPKRKPRVTTPRRLQSSKTGIVHSSQKH